MEQVGALRPHNRKPAQNVGLRLFWAAGQCHDCPFPQAHSEILWHKRHRHIPHAPKAYLAASASDGFEGGNQLQRDFRAADASESDDLHALSLYSGEQNGKIRGALWRQHCQCGLYAGQPRAGHPAIDGHQPDETYGKLCLFVQFNAGTNQRAYRQHNRHHQPF